MPHCYTLALAESLTEQVQSTMSNLFGDVDAMLVFSVLVGLLCASLCQHIALRKGYPPLIWFALGLCFGIIPLLLLTFLPPREHVLQQQRIIKPPQQGDEVPHRPTWADFQIPPEPNDDLSEPTDHDVEIGKGNPPPWHP